MSRLKQRLESLKEDIPYLDIDYMLLVLSNYKESEWFTPTNVDNDMNCFDAVSELSFYNLICKKCVPLFDEKGGYKGVRLAYLYRHDLNYKNIL